MKKFETIKGVFCKQEVIDGYNVYVDNKGKYVCDVDSMITFKNLKTFYIIGEYNGLDFLKTDNITVISDGIFYKVESGVLKESNLINTEVFKISKLSVNKLLTSTFYKFRF